MCDWQTATDSLVRHTTLWGGHQDWNRVEGADGEREGGLAVEGVRVKKKKNQRGVSQRELKHREGKRETEWSKYILQVMINTEFVTSLLFPASYINTCPAHAPSRSYSLLCDKHWFKSWAGIQAFAQCAEIMAVALIQCVPYPDKDAQFNTGQEAIQPSQWHLKGKNRFF